MSNEKIIKIQFRKDQIIREMTIDEMTDEFYHANKEFIFCPNSECDANIEFCNGSKLTYYRTSKTIVDGEEIKERHIEGCPYGLDHEVSKRPKVIYDSSKGQLISDEHIDKSLDRVFKQYKDPTFGKPKASKGDKKKRKSPIGKNSDEIQIKGKGIIASNGESSERKPHEPPLFQKFIYEIEDRDFGTSKIVKGFITGINFHENYISMILDAGKDLKGRIYFSEDYKDKNKSQFDQIKFYEQYYSNKKNEGEKVFIACAGDVKKDSFGISIYARSHKHLKIDGMSHYQLLHSMGVI